MTASKRIFDIVCSLVLGVLLLPLVLITSIIILLVDGRPIFYISERMKSSSQSFLLFKFRTMLPTSADSGVTGGDKSSRLTRSGSFLRKHRIDEVPQLLNILKGDMSFVGPRPPLRQYVGRFPDIYRQVLISRPGVTGLASVLYHQHEERILSRCTTETETNQAYERRCIPVKAKLDLIYCQRRSLCFDIILMLKTVFPKMPIK
jgi:lipopolysaccharide/colanic/teichoic acid biosynthesis glycosyltransferase